MIPVGDLAYLAKGGFNFFSNRGSGSYNQKHISLTRNPRLKFNAGESAEDGYKDFYCNARIVIDGDKLATKYSVFPYADLETTKRNKPEKGHNAEFKPYGEFEEVVLMPKGAGTINLKSCIKRVDIYDDPTIPNYMEKYLKSALKALDAQGIPYKMVTKFYSEAAPHPRREAVASINTSKEDLEDEEYLFEKEVDGNFLTIKVYDTSKDPKEQVAQFEVAPSQADPSHLYPIHVGEPVS